MYAKLIPEIHSSPEATDASSSDQLKMVVAVHRVMPPLISYEAMAATFLTMLVHGKENRVESKTGSNKRDERNVRIKKLFFILRSLSTEMSVDFDACAFMEALLSLDVSDSTWTTHDEEDKARLMFYSLLMHASFASAALKSEASKLRTFGNKGYSPASKQKLKPVLLRARKLYLSWCCNDYGPRFGAKLAQKQTDDTCGAGTPDFRSALGGGIDAAAKAPAWLKTLRCLLFLEDSDSLILKKFLGVSPEDESEWPNLVSCLRLCSNFGTDLNDDLMWVVIKACNGHDEKCLSSDMAIQLLENLFKCCTKERQGVLDVNDPTLAWELYNLTQYVPPKSSGRKSDDCAKSQIESQNDMDEDHTRYGTV